LKVYRGSKRRIRKTRLRGNWSLEVWIIIVVTLLAVFGGIPWLIQHPLVDHHVHVTIAK
jgi:hypothetical protein